MAETEELSLVVNSTGIIAASSKDSSPEHQHSSDTANFSSADQPEQLSPSTSYETPDDEEPEITNLNHRTETEQPTNGNALAESEDNDEQQDAAKNSGEHSESETQNNSESASNSQNASPDKQPNSESAKPDIDRDSRNPAFVPRSGRFFEHDDRNAEVEAEQQPTVESPSTQSDAKSRDSVRQTPSSRPTSAVRVTDAAARRSRADADSRWSHDLFNPKQQAPKSSRELQVRYGYHDVRRQRTTAEGEKTEEREGGGGTQSSERDTNGDRVRHAQSKRRPENSTNRVEQRTSRRNADDETDERLAYDDATQSDASDERASESESDARPRNGDADVDKSSATQRNTAQTREELPPRASKRPPNPGEFEPRVNSRYTDEVRVIRSRRTAEDDAERPARSARGRPNYGYYKQNYGYYDYDYDEYAYSYDYYFDDYADRDRSYANGGVRATSGRARNEPNNSRTRYTNGTGSRRDVGYFDDYAEEYTASRATYSQTQRRGPAECYYDDPGDSRTAPHGRTARPPPRSAYSARSNKSGIDAERWLHDRADSDLPAKSASLRSNDAPRSRLQPTKRPPFDADDTRATSTSLPTSEQRNASQRGRVANDASRSRASTDAPEERNGESSKLNTNGARRPNSNLNAPVESSRSAGSANRNAVSVSATPYQTVQPSYASASPSAPNVNVDVYDSQSTALGSGFYAVAATPAPSTVTPAPGSVVTSEQLNVLFDAFSAATAQFAPDVSNQILQTVAHTLMMHGAPGAGPVDAQVSAPEAYTAPPTEALGLSVPVTVPVGAPPDSNILSLVPVTVPVTVPVLPGTLLAPIGAAASPYSAPTQPPAAYSMATPFSAAASPQPPVTIAQPQPNSIPQPRRVRVPLPIIDPNDVAKQSNVVAADSVSVPVPVPVRSDER